ncbi:uncharacterized protein LOC113776350 [Coffea eugenioides]|uniref:Uncharacterized protein n=1 Tax=Coffea arabica TaxID=13443 RepID=A0A6P6TH27_COFAR|nr:uncharacterized protein LOC113701062 [Coffea arabica]XP_027177288.1 uncharacterized protein LOC113776350 [Coffea eugenioides]
MESDDPEKFLAFQHHPPNFITLSPFSPACYPSPSRRLSSCFTEPSRPVRAARRLAWVSLQGRLVGAEEASSAKTIAGENGSLFSRKEAVAWELFSPIHRILIVTVIAVAVANSKRNRQIFQLKKAVELRDQVLLRMQEKLDNLCEQINFFKDQPEIATEKNGCQLCQQHKHEPTNLAGNSVVKTLKRDEMLKCKWAPTIEAEPEERRMSDLSDWGSSVTSSVDLQLNSFSIEQDIHKLQRECEEKDVTIKELSTAIHSAQVFGSKRITELEDVIRRKNMITTKLKKDILVLEQKVVNLTRTRRPSFSAVVSNDRQLPVMADNVLYDIDNTTSPSSSDSDSSPGNQPQFPRPKSGENPVQKAERALRGIPKLEQAKGSTLSPKPNYHHQNSQPVSPLKEKSLNQLANADPNSRRNVTSSVSQHPTSRRRVLARSRDASIPKRWV